MTWIKSMLWTHLRGNKGTENRPPNNSGKSLLISNRDRVLRQWRKSWVRADQRTQNLCFICHSKTSKKSNSIWLENWLSIKFIHEFSQGCALELSNVWCKGTVFGTILAACGEVRACGLKELAVLAWVTSWASARKRTKTLAIYTGATVLDDKEGRNQKDSVRKRIDSVPKKLATCTLSFCSTLLCSCTISSKFTRYSLNFEIAWQITFLAFLPTIVKNTWKYLKNSNGG